MFASRPIRKLARAEEAAVAVIKSRRSSFLHKPYSASVVHKSVDVGGQTHVPPESDRMEAFTEMMYAIAAYDFDSISHRGRPGGQETAKREP